MNKFSPFGVFLTVGAAACNVAFVHPAAGSVPLAATGRLRTQASATTQAWNPGGAGGGSGSWAANNWDTAAAWAAGNTAVFGGTPGTVTVGTQTAGGLTFNTNGYSFVSGTLTLTGTPVVSLASGVTATLGSSQFLAATAGLNILVTGGGTFALTNSDPNLGTAAKPAIWTVTGGSTLSFTSGTSLAPAPSAVTLQLILDNGTMQNSMASAAGFYQNRRIQVNAVGGGWTDMPGNNTVVAPITNNATTGTFTVNTPIAATTSVSTISGVMSGPGSLTKTGPGTLVLSAADTYTGATIVNAGTLQITGMLATNSLQLNGGNFDLSSTNAAAISTSTLNPGSGTALKLQSGGIRLDLGSGSSDHLLVQSGTALVSGTNRIRLVTGSSLALGTSTLISAPQGGLTGSFQFDGGETLLVTAPSQIKNVGSTFYQLTLQNSPATEQVVVTAAPANVVTIMALGSSITRGYGGDPTLTGCGYRSELYQQLVNDGRFTPNFIGSQTVPVPGTTPAGYDVLIGANQVFNEGHSGYTTSDLMVNINANPGQSDNNGGFWLQPGNGKNPDYITLNIGGNDYVYNHGETIGPVNRVDAILTTLQTLRPNATVASSNLLYRPDAGAYEDAQFNPRLQGVIYNHVLAGHHVVFADVYGAVTPNDSVARMGPPDQTHPSLAGYPVMGNVFFNSVVYGSAYWTGNQDNQWSTATAGNGTNFAQNFQLTTDRQRALDAATDVYFNQNTAALPTTLGQNVSVRSLNFAAGATGSVTVAGQNTLTLGVGGITVQSSTGAHTVSANVALAANQTWGNVSTNAFTVSGVISGSASLTTVGSYTIQTQDSPTTSTTTSQTYAGTGAIILSGANTYSGGTTVSSGTLVVNSTGGSGTGTGDVNVVGGAILDNNGYVGGNLTVSGIVNGSGSFGGAVTVNSGGTFSGAAVSGPLNVSSGGLVALSGGVLGVNGSVVNNGTIRLERGAALAVGNGGTFTNNGTLDIIGGSFNAPAGFTNNGVVIDSSVVRARPRA